MFITHQDILCKKEHKSLKMCVGNEGDFVENNPSFIKGVPLIHLNLIIVIITVSEKTAEGLTVVRPLV
jgi:hypothetical protein